MAVNLLSRLCKLEANPRLALRACPKLVRVVADEEQEAEAYREANEMGTDTSPESREILIVRILCREDTGPHAPRDPEMDAVAQEHVAALLQAVDGRTRSI